MDSTLVRTARPRDFPALQAVETAAGEWFAAVGLASVGDDDPTDLETYREAWAARRLFVADHRGEPVGFALLGEADGNAHLEEIAVRPDHGRRGLGARLLDFACRWAASQDYPAITLTTFRDVPWNGPFYRKHSFEPVPDDEVGPEVRAIRAGEKDRGLDVAPREVLRRSLGAD